MYSLCARNSLPSCTLVAFNAAVIQRQTRASTSGHAWSATGRKRFANAAKISFDDVHRVAGSKRVTLVAWSHHDWARNSIAGYAATAARNVSSQGDLSGDDVHEAAHGKGIPEIQFEDIFGAFDANDLDQGDDQSGREASGVREKLEPPIPDEHIADTDPRCLAPHQLIWCVGRAATLKISSPKLWKGFMDAISSLEEAKLTPSDVCRLMQAFAYAPREAPIDERQIQRLLKTFAKKARDYNDEKLARLIYGYGKLAAKRGLSQQKFFDFAASEVTERSLKLRGFRKNRILQAVFHLPGVTDEFRSVLVNQTFRQISYLDSESFRKFIPLLVAMNFHRRGGVVDKLNTTFKQKLHGWRTPELLLHSGFPLLIYDLMKTATLISWLGRMHELQIQMQTSTGALEQRLERPGFFTHVAAHSVDPSQATRVTENLETLKRVELCLRHERSSVHAILPPKALDLLNTARKTPLEPPEDYQMLELPFVFAELRRCFRSLGLLLHPTVFGPYLLDLADPLGHLVVEWDKNWVLYPPWRRSRHEEFVQQKHLHLRAEGWRVLCVPLLEFQQQESWEDKLDLLRRFAVQHDLKYLQIKPWA